VEHGLGVHAKLEGDLRFLHGDFLRVVVLTFASDGFTPIVGELLTP
jgi:hypothetical protein